MTRYTRSLAVALVLAVSTLVACSSDKASSPVATTPAATSPAGASTGTNPAVAPGATLTIQGFAFSAVTAKAGETITLVNADTANHTVTADDGSFSVAVAAGSSAPLVIATAGTFAIHCNIHSSMKGSIVVG